MRMRVLQVSNTSASRDHRSLCCGDVRQCDGELTAVLIWVHDVRTHLPHDSPDVPNLVPRITRFLPQWDCIRWAKVNVHQLTDGITTVSPDGYEDYALTPQPHRAEVLTVDGITEIVPPRLNKSLDHVST